jgi:hypothetical protein
MINDQELAERFSLDVDRIIKNPSEEIIPAWPAPEEYIQAVALARFMVSAGLTDQCMIREELRQCLLDRLAGREKGCTGGIGDSGELDDDQLDMVAAAAGSEAQGNSFAASGCSRRASAIKGGICPDCGRPRGLHPGG